MNEKNLSLEIYYVKLNKVLNKNHLEDN